MKLGIIQGRLSEPIDNHIQEFPEEKWEDEFHKITLLSLSHIEWIVTEKSFNNKIFNTNIKKYSNSISSVCCDHLISESIQDKKFLNERLIPICNWCLENDIKSISIPLLESSAVTKKNKKVIFDNFIYYGSLYHEITFNFEIESDIDLCLELVESRKNFGLVFDTGNITSSGFDHKNWIQKGFKYINHIHLKDRTKNPIRTVEPLTGDTNFKEIFDLLKKLDYNSYYTIQTCRGETGKEIETIKKHIDIFSKLYES